MRVSNHPKRIPVANRGRRAFVAIALLAVAMPVMADELIQTLPDLWPSATALSLALLAAGSKPKK